MINHPDNDCGCGCGAPANAHIPSPAVHTQGWKIRQVCVTQGSLAEAPEQPFISLRGRPLDGEWGDIPWQTMTVTCAEELAEMLLSRTAEVRAQGWTGL